VSDTGFGFESALVEMKRGAHVARLKWINRTGQTGRQGKTKIALSPHGVIRTWYLNYQSDNGVVGTDDILANDWVVVEPPAVEESGE
jgi:hypothetical protein